MTKCAKGFLPECGYYTSAGCVSPFNCPYKVEEVSINSATITPDTGIQKYFQGLVRGGVISQEPMNYDAATLKIYIAHLEAENAELRARLEKTVELPCKVGDTIYEFETTNDIREWLVTDIRVCETCTKIAARNKSDGAHWRFDLRNYDQTWFTDPNRAIHHIEEKNGEEE